MHLWRNRHTGREVIEWMEQAVSRDEWKDPGIGLQPPQRAGTKIGQRRRDRSQVRRMQIELEGSVGLSEIAFDWAARQDRHANCQESASETC